VHWLVLAALGIMWGAFLLPTDRRRHGKPSATVEDFERRMELLAQVETHGSPGRWIVTPRKGARFVGAAERKRARARERRRTVLVFLVESIGLTFLIGLVPPLRRVAWVVTGLLVALLLLYVWVLVTLKQRETRTRSSVGAAGAAAQARVTPAPTRARHVAEGRSGWARQTFNGLGSVGEGDRVHVIVRPAGEAAGA
jgi:Flp pilus assembly protein TadB